MFWVGKPHPLLSPGPLQCTGYLCTVCVEWTASRDVFSFLVRFLCFLFKHRTKQAVVLKDGRRGYIFHAKKGQDLGLLPHSLAE